MSWGKTLRLPLLALMFAGPFSLRAQAAKHEKVEGPAASLRIPTDSLDYHPLSSFYLMARTSSASLDFIDDQHLLFTFRATGLLKRLPECDPDDEDQLIRALVLHLPDGKIERTAEWRLHDRGRYLWALGHGKFLVRQRDSLMLTDSNLNFEPFLTSSVPLRLVKLSPDGELLLVETDLEKHTEAEHQRLVEAAREQGSSPPREDVKMTVVRVGDRSTVMQARSLTVADLPLISQGFIETLAAQGNHWMLRYRPFQGEPTVIADVTSSCRPSESPLSDRMAGVNLCSERGDDHLFQAISLEGKRLWTYHWDNHYIWPTSAASQSGNRIAVSTLRVTHPVSSSDPIEDSDLQAQRVEVFDVNSGRLELTQYATPVLSGGQNYALSPNGGRFAVLRENAIEVFDLPRSASEGRPAE